ncbi:MAG: T9SS type A sorting domain-containing protein, partial [Flavobacteriales bacterium]|nr:T9SS type A sorting domain-containing protein [Flavobacteriales bacterium]
SSINIGSYNFAGQTAHTIKTWTTTPNTAADENIANDTISRTNMNPALSGTYVIGVSGDYATFSGAIDTLEAHGVCGAITLNVESATYTEQIDLQEIPGASATNRITFQSQSGDSTDVILTYALATFGDNYTVKLDGADYITFREMTISSTDPFDNRVIEITNSATFNEFRNNKLMTISGSNGDEVVHSESASRYDSNNVFVNNWFLNGNKGIWFDGPGSVTPRTGGLTIQNNLFETYRYGIYLEYIRDVTISNNRMINAVTSNGPATQGILCRGCDSTLTISKNEIIMLDGTNNYGIDLLDCEGSVGNPSIISNNMIVTGGTGTSRCIYSNATTNKKFYYNSLLTTGTNTSSSVAFYFNGPYSASPGSNANFIVKNNIFKATNGYAIINSVGGINESDYNDYISSGWIGGGRGALGEWISSAVSTLGELQTASSDDVNSVSIDPLFNSTTDLHIQTSSPVIDQALVLAEITDDIDGEGRAPDIGADEFGGSLPISLLYFSAQAVNKSVQLTWGTASETNNDYFTIERSTDGQHFEVVKVIKGAGTVNVMHMYSTIDEEPYPGVSFYRLKQTDFDGKFKHSKKIGVRIVGNDLIHIYPNPSNGKIMIQANSESRTHLELEVRNSIGQLIWTKEKNAFMGTFKIEVDLSEFGSGVYLVKVIHGQLEHIEKIIVQ